MKNNKILKISENIRFEESGKKIIVLDIEKGNFFEMDQFSLNLLNDIESQNPLNLIPVLEKKYKEFNQNEFNSFVEDLYNKGILVEEDESN